MILDDYPINRRTFVGSLATALALVALPPGKLLAVNQNVLRKTIPVSGEQLPVIGLGSSRTFDIGLDQNAFEELVPVMQAFFANGGRLIDSSPMYGSAERVIGELLDRVGHRDRLFAATKVWTDGRQDGIRQMETSLAKWGLQRFDLIQIHNLRDWRTHLATLRDWQTTGRIRYIGITTSHGRDHADLETILRNEPFDFVQFSYNIEDRTAEERLLPLAAERGLAVLINRPYQRGSLFRKVKGQALPDWATEIDCVSWGQFFLKFIVSHPAVTCAIPATSKVKHMRDNMGAGFGRLPDAAMRRRMADYFATL
ncbi:MAG: aldo/keto reductase [Desulfuromonadales bacterium]|jgi:diketogulonate reductase-like aldo/keto reductase